MSPVFNNDHNSLVNLAVGDKHTQYALLAGRATPQTLAFGTASGATGGYLTSTIHATKGSYDLDAASIFTMDEAQHRLIADGTWTVTSVATGTGVVNVGGTITNNVDFVFGMQSNPIFNGSGSNARGHNVQPRFEPSASIAMVTGHRGRCDPAPASGITITEVEGIAYGIIYQNTLGAVTTGYVFRAVGVAASGSLKPTTHYGLRIDNQGATGITTSIGMSIVMPTNSTNNYYMEFDTAAAEVNATIGSAGYIPVLIGGVARKIYYT